MNWHQSLEDIYQKLEAGGHQAISSELHAEQMKGGTGGEIFSLVVTKLLAIKRDNPKVYAIVKQEIEDMIEFGKLIHYL